MVVRVHPASPSAGRDGVSRKQINLHPGGHLGVQQQLNTRGWLRSRADWHSVVAEGFGETPQPARAASRRQARLLPGGLWGHLPEPPRLAPSLASGLWSSSGCWGVRGSTPSCAGCCRGCSRPPPPSSPLGALGGCWWHTARLEPHAHTLPIVASGSARDFLFFSIAPKRLSSYNNIPQANAAPV